LRFFGVDVDLTAAAVIPRILSKCDDLLRLSRVYRMGRDSMTPGCMEIAACLEGRPMSTLLIIIVLLLLFGGGGGYYAHGRYGTAGLGGVLGTVLVVIVVIWLVGGIH
jgi:hypothetical protein